jgi:hypothetical protein
MAESILYLSNPQPSLINVLKNSKIKQILSTHDNPYIIKSIKSIKSLSIPEQPVDQGIEILCFIQLIRAAVQYHCNRETTDNGDVIIAIENGIHQTNNGIYNISVMMVYHPRDAWIKRYNSYGTKINTKHYNKYLDDLMDNGNIYQLNQSLKSILERIKSSKIIDRQIIEAIPENNCDILASINDLPDTFQSYIDTYIKNSQKTSEQNIVIGYSHRFKEFDSNEFKLNESSPSENHQDEQFLDCIKKFIIDISAETKYNQQLKIMNKQTFSIIADPMLSDILYELLERYIRYNFCPNKIDYFVGTNYKASYLAPVVAKIFKKGYVLVPIINDRFDLEIFAKKCTARTVINVLILNEQITTGSGMIDLISSLHTIPNINILGIVSIYDSPESRAASALRFDAIKIISKTVINIDDRPTDFQHF